MQGARELLELLYQCGTRLAMGNRTAAVPGTICRKFFWLLGDQRLRAQQDETHLAVRFQMQKRGTPIKLRGRLMR
jgi:hypothetical protein